MMQDPSANLQEALILLARVIQVFLLGGAVVFSAWGLWRVAAFIRENWIFNRKPEAKE